MYIHLKKTGGSTLNTQRNLVKSNQYLIGKNTLWTLKKNGMITLMKNLIEENKAFGSIIRVWLLTLLVLTICTCSGVKLTSGSQTLGNQTDYSTYSGKLVKPTRAATACATLKIDDQVFHLWQVGKPLTKPQYLRIHALVYSRSLDPMQRRCLLTKLSQYRLTTPSFSSQYKTVWTDQRQSSRIEYQRQSSQDVSLTQTRSYKRSQVSTPRSTGRTQGTTRMTVKN